MSDLLDKGEGCCPVATPLSTSMSPDVLRKRVMLVLPWYKSTNPITALSVMSLYDRRRVSLCLNFGDAFVAHTRNNCASMFLKSDMEWSLWIDDDMIVPAGNSSWFNAYSGFNLPEEFASLNAMDRLLSHGKTLVGGLYFGRHKKGKPMYSEGCKNPAEAEFARKAPMNQIKPTRWVATGCMLIHRSVFLDIEKRFPLLGRGADGTGGNWFTSTEHVLTDGIERVLSGLASGPMTGEKAMRAFSELSALKDESRHKSALGNGEDVAFCLRAKEAGHQPFVDMGLVCGHIGSHVYGPRN